jgi:hypothetical protein
VFLSRVGQHTGFRGLLSVRSREGQAADQIHKMGPYSRAHRQQSAKLGAQFGGPAFGGPALRLAAIIPATWRDAVLAMFVTLRLIARIIE